jgi:putative ABC transport system ATP-binding protein
VVGLLEKVGLGDFVDRRPAEMSGGQQQRVAVARALVKDPSIVLADEPTANLDSFTGEGILKLMRDLNRDLGTTFIFSTHDKMVMDYARRLVVLKDGQVAEDRTKE